MMLGISRAAHHWRRPREGTWLYFISQPIWVKLTKKQGTGSQAPRFSTLGAKWGHDGAILGALRGRWEMPGGPVS